MSKKGKEGWLMLLLLLMLGEAMEGAGCASRTLEVGQRLLQTEAPRCACQAMGHAAPVAR